MLFLLDLPIYATEVRLFGKKEPAKTYLKSVLILATLVNSFSEAVVIWEFVSVFTVNKIPTINILKSVKDFYSYFIQIISSQNKINQANEIG